MLSLVSKVLTVAGVCVASPALIHERQVASAPIVTVRNGSYEGVHNEGFNQDFFFGIPYAQVPSLLPRLFISILLLTTFSSHQSTTSGSGFLKA